MKEQRARKSDSICADSTSITDTDNEEETDTNASTTVDTRINADRETAIPDETDSQPVSDSDSFEDTDTAFDTKIDIRSLFEDEASFTDIKAAMRFQIESGNVSILVRSSNFDLIFSNMTCSILYRLIIYIFKYI